MSILDIVTRANDESVPMYSPNVTQSSMVTNSSSRAMTARDKIGGTTTIDDALEAIRRGEFVVVMDNEDRENEGDLIAAAEFATEARVAFMLRHSTGIICVPALSKRIDELQLPLMVVKNTEVHQCKFTVTVDLKEGNSTGVSAADRARTIRALADPTMGPSAFTRPGHIFPLLAQNGGVMVRAGHTEAATDLARLAGVKPIGYICEMNDDNGRMLRRPQLEEFSKKFDVALITISDLIRYRSRTEALVQRMEMKETKVVTPLGEFVSIGYKSLVQDDQIYHALLFGHVEGKRDVPVFLAEDGFEANLEAQWAQQHIARHGYGVLVYVHGSAQLMQISGELMARQSMFGMAMQIARDLKLGSVRLLLTQEVVFDPHGFGVEISGSERLVTSV